MDRELTRALGDLLDRGVYDVRIVRWLDGHRISLPVRRRVEGSAVLSLYYQEECLPGRLVVFDVSPSG